jgi:hypothetical protein
VTLTDCPHTDGFGAVLSAVVVLAGPTARLAEPLLVAWTLFARKVAVIVCELTAADAGVTFTEHVAAFTPLETSVHAPLITSLPTLERTVTVPAGLDGFPIDSVSVTLTVATLDCPTTTALGVRLTVVVVARVFT